MALIKRYLVPGFDYPVSLLEIQKLVYFLTEAGEKLNHVRFEKQQYGPYADVLRHVLEKMDGHFISGYGDGQNKPETPIRLLPDTGDEAELFLKDHPETRNRFERVAQLIEGFETPFGMELLATVHWVATREQIGQDPEIAFQAVQTWNTRKAKLMRREHILSAWKRLQDLGWLNPPDGGE